MSKAKRVDSNQPIITKQLRQLGFSVDVTSRLGKGFPDLIIGFNGLHTVSIELKSKGGTLTNDEKNWQKNYKGYIIVAYDLEDILLGIHNYYEHLYNEFSRKEKGQG